jgi:hypothetical protein
VTSEGVAQAPGRWDDLKFHQTLSMWMGPGGAWCERGHSPGRLLEGTSSVKEGTGL